MVYDNIVLIGFMGSGKTTVGKVLSRYLYKEFVDVDSVVQEQQESSVADIFKENGEEHFRELEQICMNEIGKKKGQVISTGGGLPIYGSLPDKSLVIYIDADFDVILKRLPQRERDKRPLLQDEARARALFNERIGRYRELAHLSVDANQSVSTFIHVIRDFVLDKRVL